MPLLKIHSADRASGTIGNARHNLPFPISGCWSLEFSAIPVTWPNVTGENFVYRLSGGQWIPLPIPDGYYGMTELVAWVNASTPFSCAFSEISNCLTLTHSTGFDVGESLLLGFSATTQTAQTTQTGDRLPRLNTTECVNIRINDEAQVTDTKSRGFTFTIPILVNQESTMIWSRKEFFNQTLLMNSPTRDLQISLHDDKGRALTPSHDFYLILASECKACRV